MSDLEHLTQIVDTCLGANNDARNNSEALMKNLREQDINQYVFAFLNLLRASPRMDVKIFCIVHLRRILSDFVEHGNDGKWDALHPDNQKLFKEVLIELLKSDPHASIRNVLCDTIGDMASTMECLSEERRKNCTQEATQWSGLMETLWGLLNSPSLKLIESALKIMSVLFVNCGQNYDNFANELLPLFRQTITHSDGHIAVAAAEAFSCYLENSEFKKCKIFIELIPLLLEKLVHLSQSDEDLAFNFLGAIADLLESEPKMLKKDLRLFIKSIKQIVESKASDKLKSNSVENLLLSFERLTKTYRANEDIVKEGIEVIFMMMVSADRNADEEWLSPPDGYVFVKDDDDNTPDSALRFGMAGFDRIMQVLPKKLILPILSKIIMEMVQVQDWRYQHCALMSLSQVGEYIEDLADFDPIVQFVLNFLQNEHPKVRYAAIHCIGQIADDCKPIFQSRYGQTVLPAILTLYNDNIPRIVHHAMNATANFLDECPKEVIQNHINDILTPAIHLVENGKSYFKEASLLALGTLAEVCGADFVPYWERTAEAVFTILNSTKKEDKTIKGNAIESLCLIGQAVGREEFKKVCRPVIEKMLEVQVNELGKEDPQNNFMMAGWQRIAAALEEDFVPYLETVMPPVLKLVEDIITKEHEKAQKALDEDNDAAIVAEAIKEVKNKQNGASLFCNVNTSESDEVVVAIQMMKGFSETIKAGFLPYAEKASEILTHLIENSENEDVRKEAASVFPCLIDAVNSSHNDGKQVIIKKLNNTYLHILWKAVWVELDPGMMKKFVNIMIEIIEKAGRCMDDKELSQFNACIFKTLEKSEKRRNNNEETLAKQEGEDEDYEEDDEDDDLLEETNKLEEELHIALADLIGVLFKVYKEATVPLIKLIYTDVLPKVLIPEAPVSLTKFGLFLIDDIIEHIGLELIPEEWPILSEALIKYAVHPHIQLRHAAIFGIGTLGEKSKDTFARMSDVCMKVLYQGLEIQRQQNDDPDQFGSARDNIVASLGKLIKSQSHCINVKEAAKVWVHNLPLRYDFPEGKVQHELLVDIILESDATLVFGESGENLPKIIEVMAEVLETRGASDGFEKKVAKVIQFLAGSEATKALLTDAVSKLNEKSQAKLKKAVEGN